jgi:hypothetical protein
MRFGLGHIQRGNGLQLNAGAAAYIAALSVEPNDTYKAKINTLFDSLDAAGLTGKLNCLWAAVNPAQDHGDSLINIVNPGTFDLTAIGSSPASYYSGSLGRWSSTGSDGYDTGFAVGDGTTSITNFCMFVRNRHSATTSTGLDMGAYDGTNWTAFITRRSSLEMRGSVGSNSLGNHLTVGANGGVLGCIQRDGSNSLKLYRDGLLQFSSGAIGYNAATTTDIHILGFNNNGTHVRNVCPQYYAGIAEALTDQEQADLFAIMEAYVESYDGADGFSTDMFVADSWLYTTVGTFQSIAIPKSRTQVVFELQGGGGGGGGATDGAFNGTGAGIAGGSTAFTKPAGGAVVALGGNGGSPCFPTGTPATVTGGGGSGGDAAAETGTSGGPFYRGAAGSIGTGKGYGGGSAWPASNTADKTAPGTNTSVVGVQGNLYGGAGQAGARNSGGTVYCGSGGGGGGKNTLTLATEDYDFEHVLSVNIGSGGNGQTPTVGNAIAGGAGRQGCMRISWS